MGADESTLIRDGRDYVDANVDCRMKPSASVVSFVDVGAVGGFRILVQFVKILDRILSEW
jgi:hypothetical protein